MFSKYKKQSPAPAAATPAASAKPAASPSAPAAGVKTILRRPDQRGAMARAARLGQDTDAADLAGAVLDQDPRGADGGAVLPDQKMQRLPVQPVPFLGLRDTLFLDEDLSAQGAAAVQIARLLDLHAKNLSRMRW